MTKTMSATETTFDEYDIMFRDWPEYRQCFRLYFDYNRVTTRREQNELWVFTKIPIGGKCRANTGQFIKNMTIFANFDITYKII